jgi:hypothetical protein
MPSYAEMYYGMVFHTGVSTGQKMISRQPQQQPSSQVFFHHSTMAINVELKHEPDEKIGRETKPYWDWTK